jgi:hypothetical protein
LTRGTPYKLKDGRSLTVRDGLVGVLENGEFASLPTDEHIVFDNTLFIPPMGTKNRKVEGELGRYRLDLGEGYLLHGTPYKTRSEWRRRTALRAATRRGYRVAV